MEYIRSHYGVPARRGAKVIFTDPKLGNMAMVITGSRGQYILLRPANDPKAASKPYHPTWNILYLEGV